ncbi:hypothetical protein Tco_0471359 [Tanacetum coccineum]
MENLALRCGENETGKKVRDGALRASSAISENSYTLQARRALYCFYNIRKNSSRLVCPAVIRFCGVYGNVMCMAHEGGTRDENYVQWEMIHYQAETGLPFKFRHCWDVLKDSPKWKEIVLPNFNTGSKGGSKRHKSSGLEIRQLGGRDKARATGKNKGSKASRSSTMNDDALVRLMVTEMTDAEVERREAFIEIKRGRGQRMAMDEARAKIKAKYKLQY